MNVKLNYDSIKGQLLVPPSKSVSQRICVAALLHNGETIVSNFGKSADEEAALKIIKSLGAEASLAGEKLIITSRGCICAESVIHCGESGLAARLFIPIAALSDCLVTIDGSGSLRQRPMHFFKAVLEKSGVGLPDFSGHIPFTIQGPARLQNIQVDGSISSQFISGLLFAYAHSASQPLRIEVKDLVSRPYIDLTLEVLEMFGYNVVCENYQLFTIEPKAVCVESKIEVKIESDWSSAAFWISAATISGSIALFGLNKTSAQADKVILEIVERIGAKSHWEKDVLHLSPGELRAFDADLTDAPDLFPVLAVLAACCAGRSRLRGIHRLIHKESNRAESITYLLTQLGVSFSIEQDTLIVLGARSFKTIQYNCPNDHRMAMAAALAAMHCKGEMEILNAGCVSKSYPDFWRDLNNLTTKAQLKIL